MGDKRGWWFGLLSALTLLVVGGLIYLAVYLEYRQDQAVTTEVLKQFIVAGIFVAGALALLLIAARNILGRAEREAEPVDRKPA